MLRFVLILLVGFALARPAAAQTPAELMAGLVGEWEGALGYRDYQSNELFELPVRTTLRLTEDGRTMIRTSRFDEGDAPAVWIIGLSAFDEASGLYETAGFRAGRAMALTREAATVSAFADAAHWTIVFSERGMDDDRAADIRVTLTRSGDETLAVKEADYLEDPAVNFEFRNQTRLRRTP
ncbi:MAG: hypothetical protein AB7O98_02170 [Hyphomonadaceae bacterium]